MDYFYDRLKVLESKESPMDVESRLRAVNGPLLYWYESHARILPWREDPKPYLVWVSEIMLQQTRVEAVKPYFERFVEALPDVASLAGVEEERLLKLWEGLGYYNRARNLKKAAQTIMEEFGGKVPEDYEELLTLPGIGSYTAGAVASIAYGKPVPAVDGNVLRVVSRVTGNREDVLKQSVKRGMEDLLRVTMPKEKCSQFNQGLIEIGAIICIPNGKPLCQECPLSTVCVAMQQGLTGEIPCKTPKKPRKIQDMTVFLIEKQDRIAIHKRSEKGLLAALYEYPNLPGFPDASEALEALGLKRQDLLSVDMLEEAVHIFSHVEWHMRGYRFCVGEDVHVPFQMVSKQVLLEQYPIPNAFSAYTKLIK